MAIFYHSQQRDISGANAECVAIIVANCTTLGAQLRSCSTATWDDYLNEVIGHMNLSLEKEKKEGEGKSHKQKKLSCDGSASAHALLVVSNFQQSVRSFLK